MSVKIRLQRQGRKNKPFYHIVVTDSRSPRDGKYIERLGLFDTGTNPVTFKINEEKAFQWMQKGAQPSDTIRTLLSNEGVMYKMHLYKGVAKGVLKTEEADAKYKTWREEKQKQLISQLEEIKNETALKSKKQFEEETKKREEKAKKVFEKTAKLAAEAERIAAEALKAKAQAAAVEAGAEETNSNVITAAQPAAAEPQAVVAESGTKETKTEVSVVAQNSEPIASTAEILPTQVEEPRAEAQTVSKTPSSDINTTTEKNVKEEEKSE